MTHLHLITCNCCSERLVYANEKPGWIEVELEDGDIILDFCDQTCLVNYFSSGQREEG